MGASYSERGDGGEGTVGRLMRRRSSLKSTQPMGHRDSQCLFARQEQTIVVFDWDDTLFPTTYLNDELGLDWQKPLKNQHQSKLPRENVPIVEKNLSLCEKHALQVLQRACTLSRVVLVTLASVGWVDLACKNFFPQVGALLKKMAIPIVYAQEKAALTEIQMDKMQNQSNEEVEKFWGLVKGRAIAEEVDKFYSQYEGQSWKNILSIGDSSFERYGLLAATTAYIQGRTLSNDESEGSVWNPTQAGCWQKVDGGHLKKVRAKCCKLVDQPEVSELALELEMVSLWLEGMVGLDAGFDLDLEVIHDEGQIEVITDVFNGDRPVSDLPSPVGVIAEADQ